ncbi:MAG: hypothetical protein J1E39_06685 [Eubacterium sp.]|nr:hypothetical protein [Eubacterium sp.]
MKKTIAIFAALVMALTAAGCSDSQTSGTADNSSAEASSTVAENSSTDDGSADSKESTDDKESADSEESTDGEESKDNNGGEASEFDSWTDADIVNYLKAEGVFTNDDWLFIQTEGVEAPTGVSKVISYMDDYYDAYILIFWLDPNSPTARTEEIYNEIKTTQSYIMTEAGNFPQPFNTLIGRFAIFYSWSFDADLVDKTTAALEKLETEYGVKPDFVNMDIDESDYEDEYEDDDVIFDD